MNWTANQRRAITAAGRDAIVSAGAGSGKTAVLAERCAHLVAEAEPRCRIDQLLVVTFTEAAAGEMRGRIAAALQRRAASGAGGAWVRRQTALIDLAPICTIHAFCRRMLTHHFADAGVDSAFGVLDPGEAVLLREEAWDQLQSELTAGGDPNADAYEELVHCYCGGRDERVRTFVLAMSAFIESLPDPEDWLRRSREDFDSIAPNVLPAHWHEVRRGAIMEEIADFRHRLASAVSEHAANVGAETWISYIAEFRDRIEFWNGRAASADAAALDAICADMRASSFKSAPRRSKKMDEWPAAQQAAYESARVAIIGVRDDFKKYAAKGDLRFTDADWAAGLHAVAPHVRCLIDLARRYAAHYAAAKQQLGVLDFADFERRALELLRGSPAARQAIRDQYEHVLVDEFQDVSPIQAEILRMVSRGDETPREGEPPRAPNLFCVGDVKQSIYRFRLAEPALFVERMQAAAHEPSGRQGMRVNLPENFRSQPHLIDAINRIMSRLMTRELGLVEYDDAARLVAAASPEDRPPCRPALELHLLAAAAADDDADEEDESADADLTDVSFDLERIEREALVAGRLIHGIRREQPGARWRDVVILMRSPSHRVGPLSARLAAQDIPVYAERTGGFFEALEIRDMRALLSLLDNSRQDIPLAALLRSPLSAALAGDADGRLPLDESDLARLRVHRRAEPFHESTLAFAADGADAGLRETVRRLFDRLDAWRRAARRQPVAQLIAGILAATAYPGYVRGLSNGRRRAARLAALHEHARRFGGFSRQGLHRFVEYMDDLERREARPDGGGESSAGDDVVRIMSIHAAKGLQFPYVLLLDAGARFNFNELREPLVCDRAAGIGLKAVDPRKRITFPTLAHRRATERIRSETLSEELRLLYVALTRAERRVFVVGTAESRRVRERPLRPCAPGALLPAERRAAGSMLDWISMAVLSEPAELVQADDDARAIAPLFVVRRADAPTMAPASGLDDSDANRPPWFQAAIALEPLPTSAGAAEPGHVESARHSVQRIGRGYRLDALTAIPSVVAASELKRRWSVLDDPDLPATAAARPGPAATNWRQPRAAGRAEAAAPTDRGTWTHLFLEEIDLGDDCDRAGLSAQLDRLVERGRLAANEAAAIDLGGIEWFFRTEAGQSLRASAATVRRELPFIMAVDPARFDPRAAAADTAVSPGDRAADDFIVTRGIVDCLYEGPTGLTVLDWKTDSVTAGDLADRTAAYCGQLDIYARAIGDLFGRPVATRLLVYLTPRQIVEA